MKGRDHSLDFSSVPFNWGHDILKDFFKDFSSINGLIMSRHLKTKQNRTSKDLGRPGVPFQKSANSVVKMSTLGSHFSFKITVQMAIKFL